MANKKKTNTNSEQIDRLTSEIEFLKENLSKLEAKEDRRLIRAKLWAKFCSSVVSASNCTDPQTGIGWADRMLAAWDKRFGDVI